MPRRGSGAPRKRKAPSAEIITTAEEVGRLAYDLIQAAHPHLKDCSIEYLFTTKSRQSKGRPRYTSVKRLSPPERFLSSNRQSTTEGCVDFQIVVDRAIWVNAASAVQHAMLDEALSQIGYDDERERFVLRGPDIVGYTGVVERNGLWNAPLREFGEACADSLELFHARVEAEKGSEEFKRRGAPVGPQSPEEEFAMQGAAR